MTVFPLLTPVGQTPHNALVLATSVAVSALVYVGRWRATTENEHRTYDYAFIANSLATLIVAWAMWSAQEVSDSHAIDERAQRTPLLARALDRRRVLVVYDQRASQHAAAR